VPVCSSPPLDVPGTPACVPLEQAAPAPASTANPTEIACLIKYFMMDLLLLLFSK
jgi:hypothetical protein